MEKYSAVVFVVLFLITLYALTHLLIIFWVRLCEARALCQKLNCDPTKATLVVDSFAKETKKMCTRFVVPNPSIRHCEQHLVVFLDTMLYEFIRRKNIWTIHKILSNQKTDQT